MARLIIRTLLVLVFAGLVLNIYLAIISINFPPQKQRIHAWPFDAAWIQDTNKQNRLVTVKTIKNKITVRFEVSKKDLQDFHIGSIAPVTFQCANGYNEDCDPTEPYKLLVAGEEVIPR